MADKNDWREYELDFIAVGVAFDLLFILWAIFLALKLYYGNHPVNKLTFRPLYWVFAFCGI